MQHELKNKVALVTGASRGLGAAMAKKLGACGARVAVNYFGSPEKAQRVVEDIRRGGGEAEALKADVRDEREVFVKSPLILTKAVVGGMKQRRHGRIINIGSEVFDRGVAEFSNYVSAKGAQLGLTRSWAMELAKHGITVNLVAPGWIP